MGNGLNPRITAANAEALRYPARYLKAKRFNQLDPDWPYTVLPFPLDTFGLRQQSDPDGEMKQLPDF